MENLIDRYAYEAALHAETEQEPIAGVSTAKQVYIDIKI